MEHAKPLRPFTCRDGLGILTVASDEKNDQRTLSRVQLIDSEEFIRRAFVLSINEGMALLFERYYQPLCSHAVRYVSSREIAEDIVSDIFYEIQVKETFKTITTSFRAFLFKAVRYRAFD